MNRQELARYVSEGWSKVSSDVIMRCSVKCGIARWRDYPPDVVERAGLNKVRIDPIIEDLVNDVTVIDPVLDSRLPSLERELRELGELYGLDPEIEDDREGIEMLYNAREDLSKARTAADKGRDFETLDIDHNLDSDLHDVEEPAPSSKRRLAYTAKQLEILKREGGRLSNKEIAQQISNLDGGREVSAKDVRFWIANKRRRAD